MSNRSQAKLHIEKAIEFEERGNVNEAIKEYKKAIESDPGWSAPYFNIGLMYKYQNRWKESYEYNQKAVELSPKDEASLWNSGIAATALYKWKEAMHIWTLVGLDNPITVNPLRYDLGPIPVRLKKNGEVVWCERIDPARAVIRNIPTLESERSFEDIVLIDGAPDGIRVVDGKEVPVFPELDLFEKSKNKTSLVKLTVENEDKLKKLYSTLEKFKNIYFEDFTTSIRLLCHECSIDTPPEFIESNAPFTKDRTIAIAGEKDAISQVIKTIDKRIT